MCKAAHKYHKMLASQRAETCDEDEDGMKQWWRICLACEKKLRESEWAVWTPEQKSEQPNYCTDTSIIRAKNFANKGTLWVNRSKHMEAAKRELSAECKEVGSELP